MKINLLKINGFGKIKNKEINLNNNINLIYGKNEQGKTTTLKFLNSMLFGTSKNKNGKEISDFEKYKPWDGAEYSGKLEYTLNNGDKFEVFREFNKKNPKIFNSKGEDISQKFNVDKNKGIDFFYEQTGVDEGTFNSSALIEQKETILDESSRRDIIQKISNLFGSGEENISYKKIMEKLNKKYIEEVGTDRTVDRPLNILNSKIRETKNQINNIKYDEDKKIEINNKKNQIKNNIKNNENKILLLNEIKNIKKIIENKKEIINIKNNLIYENKNKLNLIEKNHEKNNIKNNNKKLLLIIILLFIIFEIFTFIIIKNIKIKIIFSIILLLLFLTYIIFNIYKNNKIKKEENNKINNEKNIINNIINELKLDINNLNKTIINEEEKEKNKIIEKYKYIININDINNYLNNNLNNIENIINDIQEENNNFKYEKYELENLENNINKNISEKISLNENLGNLLEQEKEILNKADSIKLAEEILEKSYNKMKNNISPKFIKNIINNKNEIIGEKYKNIVFSETEGLNVELPNGNYKNANLLSVGTLDQLYLSLRLAVTQEISKESLPIILDESFAYYDDERLENILKYLNNNFENYQIIIFTCSKREKEILDKLSINYNYIEL